LHADKLSERAQEIKEKLWRSYVKFISPAIEMDEGREYDMLVCTWFRVNIF
jgi:hypothetical protein